MTSGTYLYDYHTVLLGLCGKLPSLTPWQNDGDLSLQDRVAFACTYLDDNKVDMEEDSSTYLHPTPPLPLPLPATGLSFWSDEGTS